MKNYKTAIAPGFFWFLRAVGFAVVCMVSRGEHTVILEKSLEAAGQ